MTAQFTPGQSISGRPRLTSTPFPPYSYVPGHYPHPVSDDRGHMFGHQAAEIAPLRVGDWQNCQMYLWGIDLFNHGYYWEAHEAWEGLWHAAGREGPIAEFLKGLIKLAAAAVKAREGNRTGVVRHARRAVQLFQSPTTSECEESSARSLAGLNSMELINQCEWLVANAHIAADAQPLLLLDLVLEPKHLSS